TKRGAHLALSIERLEALVARPLQRIGLSATQRPLDEVARFLGGTNRAAAMQPRPQASAAPRKGRGRAATAAVLTRGAALRSATVQARAPGAAHARSAARGAATKAGVSSEPEAPHAEAAAQTAEEIAAHEIHEEFAGDHAPIDYREVTIVDAGARK